MTYRETCILLPCHSLEDFPMHYEGEQADGLLSAWTALWHPALLATTGSAPTWHRGDSPPVDLQDMLILVPGVSEQELPTGFADRARSEGARLIQGDLSRQAILADALQPVAELAERLDADLVADFLALGYAYLQVELLTRQMRYSTNLDELHFYNQAVQGARAAAGGQLDQARDQLSACFDLLSQERDHYYAVDAYVLDLTLLAPTTLGAALQQQLHDETATNLLLTAELLEHMRVAAPDSFSALQRGVEAGRVGLVGGELVEQRTSLLSCETVLRQLQLGLARFQQLLGGRPKVYGRLRYGLSVLHPQVLNRLGYIGALHAALSEGKCPEGSQLKIRWEGPDHQPIDAVGRMPLDAARPGPFLSLASKLGETMDMDHVATICLAHWPGHVCTWHDDLRRAARYGSMLGRFVTVDEYFRDTDYPGQTERFQADQYTSSYLQRAVAAARPDPLSTSMRYWRCRAAASTVEALEAMRAAIAGKTASSVAGSLIEQIDAAADDSPTVGETDRVQDEQRRVAEAVAGLIPRGDGPPEPGYLVLNPSSHVRRATLDMPRLSKLPAVAKPIYAAAGDDEHKYVVVDVPPMGFAWVTGGEAGKRPRRAAKPLAEENRLFNDYFEAVINPDTGTLQSLFEYEKRGNRLSQQLAVRGSTQQPSSRKADRYSVMAADHVRITASSTVMGEITCQGRLVDRQGQTLATFEQRYRAWRGSRVLQLDIQLDPLAPLKEDPWSSYYCCRFAWASETALLWRAVNQLRERAEAKRFEAPNYVEIDDNDRKVTLLTGGLPFHRRTDLRMLDTLLIVQGESARSFQLGVGVNLAYPLQESLSHLAPPPVLHAQLPPVSGPPSSWLFHLESRNVMTTSWTPVEEDGMVVGARVRLLETAGRGVRTKLHAFRPLLSARRLDFCGEGQGICDIQQGAGVVEMGAHEWVELDVRWIDVASGSAGDRPSE